MAKELKTVIVVSQGKKLYLPASKVIVAVRGPDLKQHQASIDITIPNIKRLKKTVRREP